ncbi:hypothetical protein ON010_g1770 [Phytophthora cinnamomi]|nr:hypothetical protein ON010_g1770 [Phytophthora cinnamomi]
MVPFVAQAVEVLEVAAPVATFAQMGTQQASGALEAEVVPHERLSGHLGTRAAGQRHRLLVQLVAAETLVRAHGREQICLRHRPVPSRSDVLEVHDTRLTHRGHDEDVLAVVGLDEVVVDVQVTPQTLSAARVPSEIPAMQCWTCAIRDVVGACGVRLGARKPPGARRVASHPVGHAEAHAAVRQDVERAAADAGTTRNDSDSPQLAQGVGGSSKLTLVDYSADAANFQSSTSSSQLVPKIMRDIESAEAKVTLEGATSARPMVVMLDSLNVLLQQTSLQQVLLLLRQLRSHAVIGSVIVRLNASAESSEVAQALAAQATALVLVETRSSLRSYPLLAKERRREIPQGMHGFVLLVRQKKVDDLLVCEVRCLLCRSLTVFDIGVAPQNGRSSESLEYFQVLHGNIRFIAAADIDGHAVAAESAHQQKDVNPKTPEVDAKKSEFQRKSQFDAKSPAISRPTNPESTGQALLPVRQEEVSFNLSISAEEQQAKSQVHLPYMHQGSGGANSNPSDVGSKSGSSGPAAGNNTLFFIDEDDPDWDDDDLDDDLDI